MIQTMKPTQNPKLAWIKNIPYDPIFKSENHIKFSTERGMLNYYVSTGTFLFDGGSKLGSGVQALYELMGVKVKVRENNGFDMSPNEQSHKISPPIKEEIEPLAYKGKNEPSDLYKGLPVYKLKFKKLEEDAKPPQKSRLADAGIDLFANTKCEWTRHGKQWYTVVKTGIALEIPLGHYLATAPRSSVLFEHKISTYHSVIDTGYLGEITFLCHSFSENKPQFIEVGERIAQVVLVPIPLVDTEFEEVIDLPIHSDRGNKGFGSTGDIHKVFDESEIPFDID